MCLSTSRPPLLCLVTYPCLSYSCPTCSYHLVQPCHDGWHIMWVSPLYVPPNHGSLQTIESHPHVLAHVSWRVSHPLSAPVKLVGVSYEYLTFFSTSVMLVGSEGGLGSVLSLNGSSLTEKPALPFALTAETRNTYQWPNSISLIVTSWRSTTRATWRHSWDHKPPGKKRRKFFQPLVTFFSCSLLLFFPSSNDWDLFFLLSIGQPSHHLSFIGQPLRQFNFFCNTLSDQIEWAAEVPFILMHIHLFLSSLFLSTVFSTQFSHSIFNYSLLLHTVSTSYASRQVLSLVVVGSLSTS